MRAFSCTLAIALAACAGRTAAPAPPAPAAPAPAPPAPAAPVASPPRSPARPAATCLPRGDARIAVAEGAVVVCAASDATSERCVAVDPAGHIVAAAVPARVAQPLGSAAVRDDGRGLVACNARGCKPLGKALVAAIAAARRDDAAGGELQVTDDLAVVVLDGKPWRRADDAPLHLVVPRAYAPAGQELGYRVEVMGAWLVSSWTTCAGPCEKSIVTDTAGHHHGALFDSGPMVRIDDRRVAVISSQQELTVTVLDLVSGKQLGTLDLGAGEDFVHAARVDATTVAFVAGSYDLTWLDVSADTPRRTAGPVAIAVCD
ncbi:MAG TPA: hypothetical protein VLX92_00155 [Kofleriaceae bacterium]|nr:hypothetical protein [Kofleriaceae bacterium]